MQRVIRELFVKEDPTQAHAIVRVWVIRLGVTLPPYHLDIVGDDLQAYRHWRDFDFRFTPSFKNVSEEETKILLNGTPD